MTNTTKTIRDTRCNFHVVACIALTAACLLPFVNKAFHVDDPTYLWTARQIQSNPLNFYGFDVNWNGRVLKMHQANFNPPLNSYVLAALTSAFGWREWPLHVAYIVPAVLAVLGVYALGKRFCATPVVAAIAALFTPALMVSATNLMTDVLMLALYVWCMEIWIRGFDRNSYLLMITAMLLGSAALLTKYFGITVVPLLLVYAFVRRKRIGAWALTFLLPIVTLALYELYTQWLYGTAAFLSAAGSSQSMRDAVAGSVLNESLAGLAYLGGGTALIMCYAGFLRLGWIANTALQVVALLIGLYVYLQGENGVLETVEPRIHWAIALEVAIFAGAGLATLYIAAADYQLTKTPESLLLACWIAGTFAFSVYFNWSITVRTMLPLVPAVAILIVRRVERSASEKSGILNFRMWLPLIPAAVLALGVTWADYVWANSAREMARIYAPKVAAHPGNVYFQGHWGFQYYMEETGAKPVDFGNPVVSPGDVVITPGNNSMVFRFPDEIIAQVSEEEVPSSSVVATMVEPLGAGFYSSTWGPLPYAFGPVPDELYLAMLMGQPPAEQAAGSQNP